jgi:aminoglycoside phosphotransferase (APT) family kinase protein
MARAAVGLEGRAPAPPRYFRIGNLLVPDDPEAQTLYWRHLHPLQRLPRRSRLARWRPGAAQPLGWADAAHSRLEAWLGAPLLCVWRPAEPGLSRAALGWVYQHQRLVAMARLAWNEHCAFLRREWRALQYLAAVPGLAATTPRLLHVEQEEDAHGARLLLAESACAGTPRPPRGSSSPALEAAEWLAGFQAAAGTHAVWDGQSLRAAIAAHPGLSAEARMRLEIRAAATGADQAPQVAAHGDYWWGNLLLSPARGLAVVDWSEFRLDAHPFHDAGFYLLTWGRDWVQGRERLPPGEWLARALAPTSRFRPLAERWFIRYRNALARCRWSRALPLDFDALLHHLPLVMAHYACHGQQAAAWTEACNAWAASDPLAS